MLQIELPQHAARKLATERLQGAIDADNKPRVWHVYHRWRRRLVSVSQ